MPTGLKGKSDYHATGRASCSFGQFGTSMGIFVNSTAMLCLSPHIPGTSDQYTRQKVKVAIAFNGQDFLEDTSQAAVTFVGTGTSTAYIMHLLTALMVAIFLVALFMCIFAMINFRRKEVGNPNTNWNSTLSLRASMAQS